MNMYGHAGAKHELRFSMIGIASAILVLALATGTSCGQDVLPAPPAGKGLPAKPASAAISSTTPAPRAQIQQAVAALGSPDYTVRERASQELWSAGAEAEPALEKAIRETDDFEVVYRARQLLQSFQWGIYADTPPEIVVLIGQFRLGNFQVKQVVIQSLKAKGKTDLVKRLIAKETNPGVRDQLNQFVNGTTGYAVAGYATTVVRPAPRVLDAAEIARRVRLRLAQREGDVGIASIELQLRRGSSDEAVRDYAAFLLSQNKLDAAIKTLRDGLKPGDATGQRRLAWMLRAKGDLAGALAAGKLANDNEFVEDLLAEMGDWKELAKIYAKVDVEALAASPNGGQKLARIMVFRHLAGEKQACDLAAAAALKAWKQRQGHGRYQSLLGALVANDRIDQAIEAAKPQEVRAAFELLVAQSRMKEAFGLVKIDVPIPAKIDWKAWLKDAKGANIQERLLLACQVLRALHVAGGSEQARELTAAMLAAIRDELPEEARDVFALRLMEVDVVVGRAESSDALAAKLLGLNPENPERVFFHLYRDQRAVAVLLWKALRKQFSAEDPPTALKHLRRLLTGKPDAKAVEELGRLAVAVESQLDADDSGDASDDETSDPRARKLLALATLYHRYGQSKLTAKYLARIPAAGVSARTLIDQGNLYAEGKQWDEAAKSYEAAWRKDPRSASALYLLGWAQSKHGEEAAGRKRMELALLVPLGDGEIRRDLVETLVRLHQDDEAARQRQWVLRLAAPHDRSIVMALMETGDAAADHGYMVPEADATNLATVWQRVAAELLGSNDFLPEARYYVQFSASAHSARARELLRAGKTAEALEELHRGEAVQPANLQLSLDCDAELRKHGAAGEADALYRRMLEQHEALCRDFPRSGTYHNDLAWLAANLDRDLDKALAHAQLAVELEPQSAGILDTLAEVHFRRGNRNEAVRLAKRCLEMDPDGAHFKKQLARFEGSPATAKK